LGEVAETMPANRVRQGTAPLLQTTRRLERSERRAGRRLRSPARSLSRVRLRHDDARSPRLAGWTLEEERGRHAGRCLLLRLWSGEADRRRVPASSGATQGRSLNVLALPTSRRSVARTPPGLDRRVDESPRVVGSPQRERRRDRSPLVMHPPPLPACGLRPKRGRRDPCGRRTPARRGPDLTLRET